MSEKIAFIPNPVMAEKFRALAERRGVSLDAAMGEAMETGAVLMELETTIRARRQADAGESYTAKLLRGPEDSLLKKLGEEAVETALAAKSGDAKALARETADLWFHCIVALARYNSGAGDVFKELADRAGKSGLAEKAARNKNN